MGKPHLHITKTMSDPTPTPPKNQDHVPRWQSEVEEILDRSDRESTSFEKARAAAIATRYKAPDRAKAATERASSRLGDGIWLALAIVLGIAAWLTGLHWPLAGRVLAIVSLILFIAFLVNAVVRSRTSRSTPKLWRGHDLNSGRPHTTWRPGGRENGSDDDDPPLVGSGR
jgi:hypothetical protein